MECSGGVASAGTADEYLSFVLRVEVDKHVARHETGLHAFGTRQTSLLIACEDTLQRTVYEVVAVEDGQLDGAADTVVGTERGALRAEPLTVDVSLDGITVEIEVDVDQLLAHHIHVALQDDGRLVLHSRRSRFADEHVARFVYFRSKTAAFTKVFQILNHLFLAL